VRSLLVVSLYNEILRTQLHVLTVNKHAISKAS